ncbi:MAG: TetR/AcrR family transcriptional regulator [Rhizobiaceae bacterium]|nr:TetR/AcrR family transcriptional regulator [Rhizobiaceae bacterium]
MILISTRDRIVERADTLFYEGGFEATSFADIAEAVGISRGNFYHHFRTKDDILDAVIDRRLERTRGMLEGWQGEGANPRERILSFINMLIANRTKIMAFGCPVGTLCSELAKLDHAAHARATDILGLFRDWLTAQFRTLGAGDRSEPLALHLLSWSQGVAVMAAAFRDEAFIGNEVAGMEAWLVSLTENSFKTKEH